MLDRAQDFRAEACAESTRILGSIGLDDPLASGRSYCLCMNDGGEALLRARGWISLFDLIFGLSCLATGAMLLKTSGNIGSATGITENQVLAVATACSVIGLLTMVTSNIRLRKPLRQRVLDRLNIVSINELPQSRWVSIEDSSTYQRLKMVPEDVALLILHPEIPCLQFEGLTHRYLVYGTDVLELYSIKAAAGCSSVGLRYRIGDMSLSITVIDHSIVSELKRQTIGGNAILALIKKTLDERSAVDT